MIRLKFLLSLLCLLVIQVSTAQEKMYLSFFSNTQSEVNLNNLARITFSNGNISMKFTDQTSQTIKIASVNRIAFSQEFLSEVESTESKSNPTVFPNPVMDVMIFKNFPKDEKLSIFTLNGMLVMSVNIDTDEFSVDMRSLKPGLYLIKTNSQTLKFSKL